MPSDHDLTMICLKYWGFDESICEPISLAHQNNSLDSDNQRLGDILNIAEFLNALHFNNTHILSAAQKARYDVSLARLRFDAEESRNILAIVEVEITAYLDLLG